MEKIEGWKTIIVSVLAFAAAILGQFGIVFSLDEQAAIATGVMAVIMLVMRLMTNTPVGGTG